MKASGSQTTRPTPILYFYSYQSSISAKRRVFSQLLCRPVRLLIRHSPSHLSSSLPPLSSSLPPLSSSISISFSFPFPFLSSFSLLRLQSAAQLAILREKPEGCGCFWVILREKPEGYVGQGKRRERNHRFKAVFALNPGLQSWVESVFESGKLILILVRIGGYPNKNNISTKKIRRFKINAYICSESTG